MHIYSLTELYRSLKNFDINQPQDRMPATVIRAYGLLKGAAAEVNVAHKAIGRPIYAHLNQLLQ